jgi:hypothetical protein
MLSRDSGKALELSSARATSDAAMLYDILETLDDSAQRIIKVRTDLEADITSSIRSIINEFGGSPCQYEI